MAQEDFGIVVGINDYQDPTYGRLDGACRDAEDFAAWLKSPDGGNVPKENVNPFTKLSDAGGNEPMLSHLLILLQNMRKRAAAGKKRVGRRLYIFLAGHGISPPELDEAGLLTVEAGDSVTPYLPGKQSADQFCLSARFEEVVLFMDCCRVTDLLLQRFTLPISEKPDPAAAGKIRRFYAFATALGKTARETDNAGVVRGVFSRVLLEGLNGAVLPDETGRMSTTQVRTYLEAELRKIKINGEEQTPHFPCKDEIVLAEGLTPRRLGVTLTYRQPAPSIAVLDGGNNLAPVTPENFTVISGGSRFLLPPGKTYVIQALDATGVATRMISLKLDAADVDDAIL